MLPVRQILSRFGVAAILRERMFESGHQRVLGITRGQQLRGLLEFSLGISLDRRAGDDIERLRQALVRRGWESVVRRSPAMKSRTKTT